MSQPARRKAVIYRRISRDNDNSISLERQEKTLRDFCEAQDWDVLELITDRGISGTVVREEADRALRLLREGVADTLVTWEFSRWSRMGLSAVLDLIETLESRPGLLFVAHKDGYRSDNSVWRMLAVILAELARAEVEASRARIKAARAFHLSQTAPEKQRHLGSGVPFGYRPIDNPTGPGRVLIPDEGGDADIVREVAQMLADGETLTDVTVWLDTNKVPTPQSEARRMRLRGEEPPADPDAMFTPTKGAKKGIPVPYRGRWRITTVRNLWRSRSLMGQMTVGVPILDADGNPVKTESGKNYKEKLDALRDDAGLPITRWTPLLEPELYARLQARFTTAKPQERRMASWLVGVLFCMECGRKLYAHRRSRDNRPYVRCSGISDPLAKCPCPANVLLSRIEEYAERMFLGIASGWPELERRTFLDAPDTAGQLAYVALQIEETTTALARDGADYGALLPRLDALKAERATLEAVPATLREEMTPTGRTLGDIFRAAETPRERRDAAFEALERIYVKRSPGIADGTPMTPEYVNIVWNSDRVPTADLEDDDPGDLAARVAWIAARAEEALVLEDADSDDPDVLALRALAARLASGDTSAARSLADLLRLDVTLPADAEEDTAA